MKKLNDNTSYFILDVPMFKAVVSVLKMKDKSKLAKDYMDIIKKENYKISNKKVLKRNLEEYIKESPDWEDALGECTYIQGLGAVVLLSDSKYMDDFVIIHELCHAVQYLKQYIGFEDMETEAYLLEYLCRQIIPEVSE